MEQEETTVEAPAAGSKLPADRSEGDRPWRNFAGRFGFGITAIAATGAKIGDRLQIAQQNTNLFGRS
jgi:hypothetical protein